MLKSWRPVALDAAAASSACCCARRRACMRQRAAQQAWLLSARGWQPRWCCAQWPRLVVCCRCCCRPCRLCSLSPKQIEGRGNGIKTNVVNNAEIAKALERPPDCECLVLPFSAAVCKLAGCVHAAGCLHESRRSARCEIARARSLGLPILNGHLPASRPAHHVLFLTPCRLPQVLRLRAGRPDQLRQEER